jgi:hypothetical protein
MSEKNGGTPFPKCFATALAVLPLVVWHMVVHARETWRLTGEVG